MKRICFLVDSIFTIGGVQRVTAVIAGALSKEYDVTIVTFDKPEQKDLTIYQLQDFPIHYQFFSYPNIHPVKDRLCIFVLEDKQLPNFVFLPKCIAVDFSNF